MAEENKSSKGIGELFVEFGAKGFAPLVKTLKDIGSIFKVSEKQALNFAKGIVKISQESGQNITGLSKLNAITGMTISQLQELQTWSKLNSVNFGELIGDIAGLQQQILNGHLGKGWNEGFFTLGIDPRELDYRKPLEAITLIKDRIMQLDEATGALALTQLGLSQNLQYVFRQSNQNTDKRLLLNEKEQRSLLDQQKAWNSLGATWSNFQTKFIANQTWINTLLNTTQEFLNNSQTLIENFNTSMNWLYNSPNSPLQKLAELIADWKVNWFSPDIVKPEPLFMTPEQKKRYKESKEIQEKGLEEERKKYQNKKNDENVNKFIESENKEKQETIKKESEKTNINNPFDVKRISPPDSTIIPSYLIENPSPVTNNSTSKNQVNNITVNITAPLNEGNNNSSNSDEVADKVANAIMEYTNIIMG